MATTITWVSSGERVVDARELPRVFVVAPNGETIVLGGRAKRRPSSPQQTNASNGERAS